VVLSDVHAFVPSSDKNSRAELQLENATSSAGAAFVEELEKGFDTQLGKLFQGGRNLSGGQWQRLALARLYYRDASMLIFDEPTAALDANAEFEVVEALRAHSSERITVIISHRFSTVRLADFIVVLEHGRVKEQGTHEELLELDGKYAGMYKLQARGYA
jgi:ATP-binding cassette, subfamily B, bacterial